MIETENIHIRGYRGTWSSIMQRIICGDTYYLMESDLFGEDIYHIIMNDSGMCVMTSVDGFNPLYEKTDNNVFNNRREADNRLKEIINHIVSRYGKDQQMEECSVNIFK